MSLYSLCSGCLSSDRTLKPITKKYLHLLNLLLSPKKGRPCKNDNKMLFCWECSGFLNRLSDFHSKINVAQVLLNKISKGKNIEIKAFSNIHVTTIKNGYDIIITENENEKLLKPEIKEELEESVDIYNESFNTIDNDYKSEYSDSENVLDNTKDDTENININNCNSSGNISDIKTILDDIWNISDDKNTSETRIISTRRRHVEDCKNTNGSIISDSNMTIVDKVKLEDEIKIENNDANVSVKDNHEGKKIKSKKGQCQKKKYKILHYEELKGDLMKYVAVSETDFTTIRQWFVDRRKSETFTSWPYKCLYCLTKFGSEKAYLFHNKSRHADDGVKFVCDICDRGFTHKLSIIKHIKRHKYKYTCKLCNEDFCMQPKITYHLQKHTTRFQCRICGLVFEWQREFYEHHKALHAFYTCDYCGKKTREKSTMERHILVHTMKYCKICDVHFSQFKNYLTHYNMKHLKTEGDSTYCVECNMKFTNINRYKYHLRTAVRHIGKPTDQKYPCPDCKKVYAKKLTMTYHYQHYHLKKSKFYCEKCNKYMLNPFRLRQHNASVHDKIPLPKNKICEICGRGFSSNNILLNHRRTHTGERPFQCQFCTAAFAQKYAMKTHMKTQHGASNGSKGKPLEMHV